jgi:MSHA biogenesis protein MshE
VRIGASDVHIEPQEHRLVVRMRVDGVLQPAMDADPKIAPAVLLRIKILASLNISEKRLPQDGRFNINVRDRVVDVRLSTLPTQFGESAVMRILSTGDGPRRLDKIGMPAAMLAQFKDATSRSSGLILVTGPTGSGKTTTLYSALNELNKPDTKIITVEDPVEYRLPGINQVQINDKIELTFGSVLRSVLRQDPDVILVGEMRDQETAQIGLRAAITGHLVFSTLHTRDAASTPMRLIDMGVPSVMVASALQSVLAQRLARMNCSNCTEPAAPSPQEMAWLEAEIEHVPQDAVFMKGRGCSHCSHSGYAGRSGLYELLTMDEELVGMANRSDPDGFMRLARHKMKGATMQVHGLELACRGKTTVAEIMRVASSVGE